MYKNSLRKIPEFHLDMKGIDNWLFLSFRVHSFENLRTNCYINIHNLHECVDR